MNPTIQKLLEQLSHGLQGVQYVPQGAPIPEGHKFALKFVDLETGADVVVAVKLSDDIAPGVKILLGLF